MQRAFIIRPFGTKMGVDFDRVERELISPALGKLGIFGGTTGEILSQGNIREDMFYRLLAAELVVADVSIPNANVFYELGIRHALQDKATALIRCRVEGVRSVFDIAPERYAEYACADPGATVDELARRIEVTLAEGRADSPLFIFLPELKPQARDLFIKVPREFAEDVERARAGGHAGDLDTFASELRALDVPWALGGMRLVGEAQFRARSWEAARETWEAIRDTDPDHQRANQRLATIYQKQAEPDLTLSDLAVDRLLGPAGRKVVASERPSAVLSAHDRAELYALRASNAKTRWIEGWWDVEDVTNRRRKALGSKYLLESLEDYERGFLGLLNHYYSGLNALALHTVLVALADVEFDEWALDFEGEREAQERLERYRIGRDRLAAAVEVSIHAAVSAGDVWAEIGHADHLCLTSKRPRRVARAYARCLEGADAQQLDAVRRQIEILHRLGVVAENAAAALETIGEMRVEAPEPEPEPGAVVVFSGHRLDAQDRLEKGGEPRFPAGAEEAARALIREAVAGVQAGADGPVIGYAGGASGGDILFHEVCDELGIESHLYLAGPRDAYVAASVQDAGGDWVARFDDIRRRREGRTRELTDDLKLPRWLAPVPDFSIWEHNNIWILNNALARGEDRTVLIALWNHAEGEGPGGTQQMVEEARRRGARDIILDARPLKAFAG